MKLLLPTSLVVALVQFANEIQEAYSEIVTIAQMPGMNIAFSAALLAFTAALVPALCMLRTR